MEYHLVLESTLKPRKLVGFLALLPRRRALPTAAHELDGRRRSQEYDGSARNKALRPGPSGNENAPNHANYDETQANPFPDLPDVLKLKSGAKVTTAKMWCGRRRPEIVEDFEREVLGRVPKNVPQVTWTVTKTVNGMSGSLRSSRSNRGACGQFVVSGDQRRHSDDAHHAGRCEGSRSRDDDVRRGGLAMRGSPRRRRSAATEQLIADGWGYA